MRLNIKKISLLFTGCILFSSAQATQITIVNQDVAGVGLNDSTAVTPVTGNPGTTKGEQALNVFKAAANYWEKRLHSPVEIKVNMNFAQLYCTANSAVLGSAGATSSSMNFINAPEANTWFPMALNRSLIGLGGAYDLGMDADINAQFNGGIGQENCLAGKSWSYVIDDSAPPLNQAKLYQTAIHEIGHGLGFATLVNSTTGQKAGYTSGGTFYGFDDQYMKYLKDTTSSLPWTAMTDAQRAASAKNTGNLIWTGAKAVAEAIPLLTAGKNGNNPSMYAPDPVESGSSVSHWSKTLSPDELMEPALTPISKAQLTTQAFYDMHWVDPCRITKTLVAGQWTQISLPCVAPSNANTVAAVIGDDMTGTYGTDWVVYSYDPATNAYVDLGTGGVMESGKGYWVISVGSSATLDMPHNSIGANSSVATECTSTNDCFDIALATKAGANQWQMIGNPYRDNIKVADIRLHKNTGSSTCNDADGCTFNDANQNTLANNELWSYNGTSYQNLLLGTDIEPWTGAWLATLSGADGSAPKLYLPKKEAIPSP